MFVPAQHLGVRRAQVLGEHGTSEVFLWLSARVAGVPMLDVLQHAVRYANIAIIEGNLASQYGIGMVSARIAEIVLRDERAIIPVGSYNPRYDVTLTMPSVLGRNGSSKILEPEMSQGERLAMERSAETIRKVKMRATALRP